MSRTNGLMLTGLLVLATGCSEKVGGSADGQRHAEANGAAGDGRAAATEPRASEAAGQNRGAASEKGGALAATAVRLEPSACGSEASAVSLAAEDVPAHHLLEFLAGPAGVPLTSDVDVSAVTVSVEANNVPWDCVLQDLAEATGLVVEHRGEAIALTRPPR